MSAIRILILGVLNQNIPMHGYEVRRELESWNAEQWASIAYGSIYFSLKTMAQEGLIETVEPDKQTSKIVYKITKSGKEEFERLLKKQWWEIKPIIDPFQVALVFMNYMPREELLLALEQRIDYLKNIIRSFERLTPMRLKEPGTPRHVAENFNLGIAHTKTELACVEAIHTKVKEKQLP